MTIPQSAVTVIATGFTKAIGCDYQLSHNRLIVADTDKLSATTSSRARDGRMR